jgi:hypothetical protein
LSGSTAISDLLGRFAGWRRAGIRSGGTASRPPTGNYQPQYADENGKNGKGDRRPTHNRIPGVGTGQKSMDRAEHPKEKARAVNAPPQTPGQMAHEKRGQIDGNQQIQRDDSPRDRTGLPGRGKRDKELRQSEMDVTVESQTGQVHPNEGDRQAAQEPVQVEVPCRRRDLTRKPAGDDHSPQHRRGNQSPGDQATSPGHVPPELMVYDDAHVESLVISVYCHGSPSSEGRSREGKGEPW